jgi:O-methyltransferase involved in polyketide biosynthesis
MKQETLEEAAENHAKIFQFPFDCDPAETFIAGAKWQQERMYSEEDMKKAFNAGEENVNNCYTYMPFEEWFETFKNK